MSIKVMTMVWDRDISPASHKLIALKLADFANDDGERVFPSLALVARKSGVSPDTARRAIDALKKSGVLREIRRGGNGPKSTNEYAFDLAALAALPEVDCEPESDAPEDGPEPVDSSAKGGTGATLSDENKGSNLLPLEPDKGSTQNAKGGTGATQTVKNLDKPPLSPTAVGEIRFVDFESFETIWPWYGDERRDTARSAWADLDEINRRAAVDHAPRYLADLKAGKGRRKKRIQAAAYLRSEIWKNRKPSIQRVKRTTFAVKGTPAWDYAIRQRAAASGMERISAPTHSTHRPGDRAAVTGWNWPIDWFDGADLPDEVAAGKGRDWWIVETRLDGEKAA